MAPPLVSVPMKKKKKPSLVLTLSAAGLLIGAGTVGYWLLSQRQISSGDLLVGANIIPGDALFAVSLTTDPQQWQKLRQFGTKETQAELDKNLVELRDRFLTNNGYDFQKDIAPWVGNDVTIAILAPATASKAAPKPVATNEDAASDQQSMVMVLPVKNPEIAKNILAQPKTLKQGKWIDRIYQGIAIKQSEGQAGENFSAALLDGRFLVITDSPKATERAIDAYKNQTSLATTGGFAENFPKIANDQRFGQFYVNVPTAAKIAAASPNRPLPAQVLAQLQNNQGLAGTMTLEAEGIRFKGVSWLNPNSQRVLAVENKAGKMQSRVPAETLMMLSGGNLQRLWGDYVLTSQGNPLSPIAPEQLRGGIKSLTTLDLDKDLLSWMKGEFSLSVIPSTPKEGSPDNFRSGLVFMVQGSDRNSAEASIKQLDDVMRNQYQFQVQSAKVAGQPVVNWVSPYGTLTATHGWLDGDVAFLVVGAPITDKIVPKPNNTLASTIPFQQTVPTEPNPTNGQFFLDVERTVKNFPLPTLISNQQTLLDATRSIGMTSAVSDSRSNLYDIFIALKKVSNTTPLPSPESNKGNSAR
ncbi:hypothetical protein CDG77_32705 [Nostoc sp. 'Peltigera membranacea cyanobiont' 213]|uniref:DUF3352 domain-containing protein n=1 Tax=unclassified Nostoc TaxID=2593658 RepID=UPI000B9515F0|nr:MULTISPECIES: DUF3352 domain-containing protein [unclassified Nostoc]AVH66146.1 protein of unknown function DUF3352 [Nostoc sp. 'Peltigera membranacea cyanobiont' N6]OYD86850.1 hypothetical protein CDG77_32705 [Nostoc sp. 'Peltigera membranacea cyanobiont' 213]